MEAQPSASRAVPLKRDPPQVGQYEVAVVVF